MELDKDIKELLSKYNDCHTQLAETEIKYNVLKKEIRSIKSKKANQMKQVRTIKDESSNIIDVQEFEKFKKDFKDKYIGSYWLNRHKQSVGMYYIHIDSIDDDMIENIYRCQKFNEKMMKRYHPMYTSLLKGCMSFPITEKFYMYT